MYQASSTYVKADVRYPFPSVGTLPAEKEEIAFLEIPERRHRSARDSEGGLEFVDVHLNAGVHLLRGVPRKKDTVQQERRPRQAAAVESLGRSASPHVRCSVEGHLPHCPP